MADKLVSELTALSEAPATGDLLIVLDISDATDDATGTVKKITYANVKSGLAASGANSDITSLSALSTPLSIAQGGTAAASASAARTALGLAIGTNVQAWDADLDTWATKTAPSGTVVGTSDTQTLTNKRITKRVGTAADATSITPDADSYDEVIQVNTQGSGTLTINAPTGTPTDFHGLVLRIKSTNSQTYSFNATYKGGSTTLPTTHGGSSKYDYIGFLYNSTASKWDMVALSQAVG